MGDENRMKDGYATLIALANLPNVLIYELSITPGATQGGEGIDITTMRSNAWRQMHHQSLKSLDATTLTVNFALQALEDIESQINVNQLVTLIWPDGDERSFWGFIQTLSWSELTIGQMPTWDLTIMPTLTDDEGNETAPTYTQNTSN